MRKTTSRGGKEPFSVHVKTTVSWNFPWAIWLKAQMSVPIHVSWILLSFTCWSHPGDSWKKVHLPYILFQPVHVRFHLFQSLQSAGVQKKG